MELDPEKTMEPITLSSPDSVSRLFAVFVDHYDKTDARSHATCAACIVSISKITKQSVEQVARNVVDSHARTLLAYPSLPPFGMVV
jgi:hypothetical protein